MATVTLELPPQKAQTVFNLHRWAELLADPELARFEGRVETDRHGHVIMSPPSRPNSPKWQPSTKMKSMPPPKTCWPC